MESLETRSRIPRALVRLGLQSPRWVLIAWASIACVSSFGVARLQVETSTDSVLDRSSPPWAFYQESQRRFGGDEILTLLIEGDVPFDPAVLREVARFTERFEVLPGVKRVDSLSTVPLVHSSPDGGLSLEAALAAGVPDTPEALHALALRVRADRVAPRTLVSSDERAFAVNLVLERGAEPFYGSILSEVEKATRGGRVWVSGVPVFRLAADARTRTEFGLFIPLTILVACSILVVLFRNAQAVFIPVCSSGLGVWIMLGVMGALEVPVTITTVVLPSVLLALGCAYSLHLLSAASSAAGSERVEALLGVSFPVALSGLTTTLGFLAVSFVRIDAIRDIGIFGALGVLSVLAATLTVGPAALTLWPLPIREARYQRWIADRATPAVLGFVRRYRRGVLATWLIAMVGVSVGLGRLAVETDVILWFQPDDPIRVAYQNIRDRLSGISPLNVVIEASEPSVVNTPEVLSAIDRLSTHLESLPAVGRAISIADPLRQLHGGFLGDATLPLPESEASISQYLVLLESKPYVRDLITADWKAANLLLRVDDNRSGALQGVAKEAERWWAENGARGYTSRTTGIMYEFARAEDAIAFGQLRGLAFAFLTVAGLLFAIFRSLRIAWIALVPNLVPIAMGFGAMGLLGVPLDAGTVVIANLAFGMAVDDRIHAVTGFFERWKAGDSASAALESNGRGRVGVLGARLLRFYLHPLPRGSDGCLDDFVPAG
jgi:predicted RND superfamily exporter protein